MEEKKHSRNYSLIALAFVVFTVNLGTAFDILGVNLSWISSIVLLAVFIIEKKKIKFVNRHVKKWFYFFIAWSIYGGMQLLFVKNISLASDFYIILLINNFICILMLLLIKSKKDFLFILNAFTLSLFANIIAAYYELFTGTHIIPIQAHQLDGYLGRVGGFIGNFNDFCTFLFIAIVIFLLQIAIVKSKKIKAILIIGVSTSIHLIYINGARGGIYAVWILLLTIPFIFYNKWARKSLWKYPLIVFSLAFLTIGVILFPSTMSLGELIAKLGTPSDYGSDMVRVILIEDGIKAFFNSFGFGVGAGQSILLNGINIHNFYIEIICEYGIFFGIGAVVISFVIPIQYSKSCGIFVNSLLQATAFSLIVANVTSSSSNKMRAMWIFLILILLIKNVNILSIEEENYTK